MKRVLVACEESQAVTIRLRALGIEAYSCDIEPASGDHPEWHLQQDVTPLLREEWDMILAFPPCTHLAVSGARHFEAKRKDGRQQQGVNFFMQFTRVQCSMVAIENPIGIMSSVYRKPTQIIQPWEHGHKTTKATCLWLKGLPRLKPTKIVSQGEVWTSRSGTQMSRWFYETSLLPLTERGKARSKTFPGIADAMAEQWGGWLLSGQRIPEQQQLFI